LNLKKILIPLTLTAIMMLTTGCSSASDGFAGASLSSAETTVPAIWANDSYMENDFYGEAAAGGGMSGETLPSEPEIKEASEKKIIRNADISLETPDMSDTYAKLTAKLNELGGSVFSEHTQNNNFSAYTDAVFTLPPENLDAFLAYAGEVAEVVSQNISSEDITGSYVDTEVRLENKRRNLEKYYEYLDDADTLDEMIMLQNQIDSITADIESFETRLKLWNANLSESRVTLNLVQPQDPNAVDIEDVEFSTLSFKNMGKLMENGIKKCVDVIGTLLQWLVIVLFTLLPVIVIAAIVIFIVVMRNRALDKKYPERVTIRQAVKERKRAAKLYYKEHGSYQPKSTVNTNNTSTSAQAYRKPPEPPKNTTSAEDK
jgi:hypothetical protein